MSKYILTITGIEAALKGQNVLITAYFPDGGEKTVKIEPEDIKQLYDIGPKMFMELYGENEDILSELFISVTGITISEPAK